MYSMTAFSRQECSTAVGTFTCEARSVNHRFLELSLRLPEMLRPVEDKLRAIIRKKLSRGKVDVSITMALNHADLALSLNEPLLENLLSISSDLAKKTEVATAINTVDLLNWPGLIQKPKVDEAVLEEALTGLISSMLDDLMAARNREGLRLKDILSEKLAAILQQVNAIKPHIAELYELQKQKLLSRLEDLNVTIDENRLEQELVVWLQKIDVAEELDRLEGHVEEAKHLIEKNAPVGRKLDFLLQEFNREANTLASKATTKSVTASAIEIKVLVEQLREQVQNIE